MGLFLDNSEDISRPRGAQWSWWGSLFLLCAILGVLFGLAFKTQRTIRQQGGGSGNYEALLAQYRNLTNQVGKDQLTIASLQSDKSKLESQSNSAKNNDGVAKKDLVEARMMAGLTEVTGPGVIITLNDSKKRFPDAPTDVQNLGIIHDHDIYVALNELKGAGAEAFSVNGQRIVATTPIRCVGNNVFINNTHQTPPYKILAIGEPKTLQDSLNLPEGFADGLRAIDPAMFTVVKSNQIKIPAYSGAVEPQYAHQVTAGSSDTTAKQ